MRWAEITAACSPESVDAVSYAFLEAGCGGVTIQGERPVKVCGSLPVTDELSGKLDALKTHLDRLPEFGLAGLLDGLTLRYAEEEDWANAWKQYFKPMKLGNRIVIKPSWEEYTPTADEIVLELDPGMAFGTGGHPTTQLCLLALEDRIKPGMKVADIGTGSGILSLAAARLGAADVIATDIDLIPRKVARENVSRNSLENTVHILEMDDFDISANERDLVVANIVANTIIELASTIAPRIVPNGIFIASGIVEEHHDLVRDTLRAVGLEHLETKREDIWVCLISRKNPDLEYDMAVLQRSSDALPAILDLDNKMQGVS